MARTKVMNYQIYYVVVSSPPSTTGETRINNVINNKTASELSSAITTLLTAIPQGFVLESMIITPYYTFVETT